MRPLNPVREGGVSAKVPITLPDPVGVGGSDLVNERNHITLEMERDLHVEVAHAAEQWWRQTSVRAMLEVHQQRAS